MPIPDSITLLKATKIASKIERLQEKLHALLGDTLELPPATAIMTKQLLEVAKIPRRRGRPPGSGRKLGADGIARPSKLAGRARPSSPSGPLAPAVVKVLQRYGRAMKVTEILIALEHDNYIWTAKNPRQTLYVRIGKLAGVSKVDEGLYIASELLGGNAAPVGIIPEPAASMPVESFEPAPAAPEAPVSHESPVNHEGYSAPSEHHNY
jgi:hypothetical protein